MPIMQIGVINRSTKVSNLDVSLMAQACAIQMMKHLAPAWMRIPVPVVYYAADALMPSDTFPIIIFDDPDAPNALGYHTEDRGQIYGRVFAGPVLDNGGVVLYDPRNPQNTSVASVLSHEVCELFCDPFVNSWVDGPAVPQGCSYALEVADPVEGDSYAVDVPVKTGIAKVSVSNFVFPEWFDSQSTSKRFDFMEKLTKPFTMTSGGYIVLRNAPGSEQQIFGEMHPDWKKLTKTSPLSRTSKRMK